MSLSPTDAKWIIYPPVESPRFVGLQTNVDPSQTRETAHVSGQNTDINDGDHISTRKFGLTLFPSGDPVTSGSGIKSMYTFRLRTGENIMLRAYGAVLEWFDETTNLWINLRSGLSSDDFGFAEFNINADAESRVYMGNGVDDGGYWNGGHTTLDGALSGAEGTINVTSTASFSLTGTLRIGTTEVTYTGVTGTSFTGCTGAPAATDGLAISQAVTEDATMPKGNIIQSAQNRLFIVPEINPQIVQFSAYGDSTAWSTNTVLDSTATSAGAFNLIEGGGRVNAMTQDEASIYLIKDSCIYTVQLSDSLYSLKLLKPFDGRSRATGAIGKRGVFIGGNYVFIVTPDNQIKSLQRVPDLAYPQLIPISELIEPTADSFDFSAVTGISFKQFAYFACKSSADASVNDTVLVFNMDNSTWESPIVGWSVGEWAIYDDGDGEKLYFGDVTAPNVWQTTKDKISDGPYIITSSYKTKQISFGSPSMRKKLSDVFIEGFITPTTDLTITLYLDEDGYSGITQTILKGSESAYIIGRDEDNKFGVNSFGTEMFGSNDNSTGLQKFRVHLSGDLREKPFYNCQLEFSSSGVNQRWKIIRYGFFVRIDSQPTQRSLIRAFK